MKKMKSHTKDSGLTSVISEFMTDTMESTYMTDTMESTYMTKALETQVGGDHYKDMQIQPIEYILKNNLGYCEANVVKYISRWQSKNGIEDLRKARHYIDLLIDSID